MNKYDLIIFDCDGTLIESESSTAKALSIILQSMGFPQCSYEYCHKNFASINFERNVLFLKENLGPDFDSQAFANAATKVILNNIENNLTVMPGAEAILRRLDGVTKCVASNGKRGDVLSSLEKTGLLKFFNEEHIFTYHQAGRPKPDPDLFLFAARKMGYFMPERCLVIEDSDTGVKAANAADMDVIVMRSKYNPRQENLSFLEVKAYVDDLTEIENHL